MNMMMAREDGEELIRWFLDNGANANGIPTDLPPIRYAAGGARSIGTTQLLLTHGPTLKNTGALHGATFRPGRDDDELALNIMNLLLDKGIDINEQEFEGVDKQRIPHYEFGKDHGTALHVAAQQGFLTRAKLLVDRGVAVGKKSEKGYTAKDWAQINQHEHVWRYLESVMRECGMDAESIEVPECYTDEESFDQGSMP